MKTKLINLGTILWIVIVALNESGVFDLMPNGGDWLKFIIAAIVVIVNAVNAQMQIARRKEVEAYAHNLSQQNRDSIPGGGIQNPPPKKKP